MNKNTFIDKVLEAERTLYHVSKSILSHDQDCEDAVQGAILNVPSGTVKSRLSKGRKLLKLKLEYMEGIYE